MPIAANPKINNMIDNSIGGETVTKH